MAQKTKYKNKDKIRDEFITTDLPYRALAEKHGIPRSTIERWMREEKWQKKRELYRLKAEKSVEKELKKYEKSEAKATEGKIERRKNAQKQRTERLFAATDKLIDKAVALLDLELSPRDLKAVSGTLVDARMLYGIRTDLEVREQEAKIKQLEKSLDDKVKEQPSLDIRFLNENGEVYAQ